MIDRNNYRLIHDLHFGVLMLPRHSGFIVRNIEAPPEEWELREIRARRKATAYQARERVRGMLCRHLPRCVVRAALCGNRRAWRHVDRLIQKGKA